MFKWIGAEERLTIIYDNYIDGEWEGLIWPGEATEVRRASNCSKQQHNEKLYDIVGMD